jgi:hypothetical protein
MEIIHNLFCCDSLFSDYVILKNRKVMGTLQHHRIQQRSVATSAKKQLIEEVKATESNKETPKFRIIREPPQGNPELLTVQVHIRDVVCFSLKKYIFSSQLSLSTYISGTKFKVKRLCMGLIDIKPPAEYFSACLETNLQYSTSYLLSQTV